MFINVVLSLFKHHQVEKGFYVGLPNCEGYNPPSYLIGRHVFLSGNLSVLSDGTVILLTLVTINLLAPELFFKF